MAMGLRFSGREPREIAEHWSFHLLGAAAGGAAVGVALGGVGDLFALPDRRAWIVAAAGVPALVLAIKHWGTEFGRHRQVPRHWGRTMPRRRAFFLWGVLLGSGVATLIPYSAVVLVLGTAVAGGPVLGAAIGAALGLGRQGMTLLPLVRRFDLAGIMAVPERFAASGPRANLALVAAGTGAALAAALIT